MPIIRSSSVLYKWLLPIVFGAVVFKFSVWCGAEGCVSGLRAAALLDLGAQHSVQQPLKSYWNNLIVETERAIRLLDTRVQDAFRHMATKQFVVFTSGDKTTTTKKKEIGEWGT